MSLQYKCILLIIWSSAVFIIVQRS